MTNLHPRLLKQLKRARLDATTLPTSLDEWQHLLNLVAQSYNDTADAQALLERSLEVSSNEMRQLYDDLKLETEQRIEALHNSEQKNRFLANMSHELRTPIHGILGSLEIVKKTTLDERQQLFINTAYASCETMLDVINNILDFSKLKAGDIELFLIEFSLRELLENISSSMSNIALNKHLNLQCLIAPSLPDYIKGDPIRLRQVLTNLINNAIKFTEEGNITLSVDVLKQGSTEAFLRFEIQDTGIGIPPAMQKSIFESFVQVDATVNRRYGGTGLGLTIVREFVEMMGGRIGVTSTPYKGSTFWFELRFPIVDASQHRIHHPLEGKRVLVVDDNETNRLILETHLHTWNCEVVSACNAQEALHQMERAHLHEKPFDILLLDWFMPQIDGLTLAKLIRTHAHYKDIPIVMITSYGLSQEKQQQVGIQAALTKPITSTTLRDVLIDTLKLKQAQAVQLNTQQITPHILLAEDNQVNALIALAMLEQLNLKVDHVTTGAKVLEALQKQPYNLILMDINMPEMDGYTATRHIRQWEQSGILKYHIPIIAMTANALNGDEEKCIEAGMDDYLSKPVKQDALIEVVGQWLTVGQLKVEKCNAYA